MWIDSYHGCLNIKLGYHACWLLEKNAGTKIGTRGQSTLCQGRDTTTRSIHATTTAQDTTARRIKKRWNHHHAPNANDYPPGVPKAQCFRYLDAVLLGSQLQISPEHVFADLFLPVVEVSGGLAVAEPHAGRLVDPDHVGSLVPRAGVGHGRLAVAIDRARPVLGEEGQGRRAPGAAREPQDQRVLVWGVLGLRHPEEILLVCRTLVLEAICNLTFTRAWSSFFVNVAPKVGG